MHANNGIECTVSWVHADGCLRKERDSTYIGSPGFETRLGAQCSDRKKTTGFWTVSESRTKYKMGLCRDMKNAICSYRRARTCIREFEFEFERGTYGDGEALGNAAACAAAAGVAAQSLGTKGLRQPVPQRGAHLHT